MGRLPYGCKLTLNENRNCKQPTIKLGVYEIGGKTRGGILMCRANRTEIKLRAKALETGNHSHEVLRLLDGFHVLGAHERSELRRHLRGCRGGLRWSPRRLLHGSPPSSPSSWAGAADARRGVTCGWRGYGAVGSALTQVPAVALSSAARTVDGEAVRCG